MYLFIQIKESWREMIKNALHMEHQMWKTNIIDNIGLLVKNWKKKLTAEKNYKLTFEAKCFISMAPFLSTLIGWIFIPAIWALAGLVPCADVGIKHTYTSQIENSFRFKSTTMTKINTDPVKNIEGILPNNKQCKP